MDKKVIKFDDNEIEEYEFHQHKSPIWKSNIDINKIVVYNKLSLDKQAFIYLIGYKDAEKIKPLCVFCPKANIYKTSFNKNRCMYFSIKDEKIFKNRIWKKVRNIIKKEFNSTLV